MRIYHLLKTANAEVESDFLKPTRKVEKKTIYGYWLVNNDICYLGQWEPVTLLLVKLC